MPLALALTPQGPVAKPQNSAKVEGVFVDPAGEPVGGVRVLHRIWPGAESTSESGADGRFEVTLAWDAQREGTWYAGHARKRGYAKRELRADLRAGQHLDLGRLQLDPGGVLTGAILDKSGAPLSGAMLAVVSADEHAPLPKDEDEDGSAYGSAVDHGTTDAQGRFEIIGVPPGAWRVAAKHASSFLSASAPVELAAGASAEVGALQLEPLPPEYRIEGKVLGPDGEPVPGAELSTSVPSRDDTFTLQTTAQTDGAGRFVLYLARLPRGTVELDVKAAGEGFADLSLPGVKPGARDVVAHLGRTLELRLHVVDERGLPVETYGWGLTIEKPDSIVMTGSGPAFHADGCASLRVPEHPFELEIRSDAHNLKKVGAFRPDSLPPILEVVLSSGAAISGDVTFQGRPVPGVFVELVQRHPNYLGEVVPDHWNGLYYGLKGSTTIADATGAFRIPNDFPHLHYYARAWAEGYAEGMSGPVQVGASGVHVELRAGGSVAGVVRAPGGLSPEGIELEFFREEIKPNDINTSEGKILRAQTAADGTYLCPHLAAGTWLVKVNPTGTLLSDLGWSKAKAEDESHPFVVEVEEEKTTACDIALGADPLCILEGRLTAGDKIREGYGKLLLEGPYALDVSFSGVDERGRFRLVARRPGTYRLLLHAGPGHYQYSLVTDLVGLTPGTTTWERDLPVERWSEGVRLDRP